VRTVPEALRAELLKARRSRVPLVSALAFVVGVGAGGLFMFILADPERARSMGLLGSKAQLVSGAADWPTFLAFLAQIVAVGGTPVFGLVAIWIFGREFSDGTAKDLLALPTARSTVVAAKFVLVAGWCLVLAAETYLLGLVVGAGLRLPGWSTPVALHGLAVLAAAAAMTVLLVTPFALAASVFRGYLAAVGVMLGAVFAAQVVALLGYGGYFPWSVPALAAGLAGPDAAPVGPAGVLLVLAVGAAGVATTLAWWGRADQDR
jgi:ABC-2 type transport system permease protein